MASKNKSTKEEMVEAALRVVRAKGIDDLTAKAIADELGTSTGLIFTCFGSMEKVKAAFTVTRPSNPDEHLQYHRRRSRHLFP